MGHLGCSCASIAIVFACRSAGGKIALGIVSITKVSRFSSQTLGPEFTKEVCFTASNIPISMNEHVSSSIQALVF